MIPDIGLMIPRVASLIPGMGSTIPGIALMIPGVGLLIPLIGSVIPGPGLQKIGADPSFQLRGRMNSPLQGGLSLRDVTASGTVAALRVRCGGAGEW